MLEEGQRTDRVDLAANPETAPEMLYYLAEEDSAEVRCAVAANSSAPIHANEILAGDELEDVRAELARKVARLVPDLDKIETDDIRDRIIGILEKLAQDQLPRVRAIVSEEIRSAKTVPKSLILQLAQDAEAVVACPVLEYSPLLGDMDLKEIIAMGIAEEALEAVARRHEISGELAETIVNSLEMPAISTLLLNKGAEIREQTVDQIVEMAKDCPDLHEPLALRPNLSIRTLRRIAGFVASALVRHMTKTHNLDEATAEDLIARTRDRIDEESLEDLDEEELSTQIKKFSERGMLDDEFIVENIDRRRRPIVLAALAEMAFLDLKPVKRVIESKDSKAITALAHRAGLRMRTAMDLQSKLAIVPGPQILNAKDGLDYPFSDSVLAATLKPYLR